MHVKQEGEKEQNKTERRGILENRHGQQTTRAHVAWSWNTAAVALAQSDLPQDNEPEQVRTQGRTYDLFPNVISKTAWPSG